MTSKFKHKAISKISVYDCLGNKLEPGDIIAYAAGAKFKFGVFEKAMYGGSIYHKNIYRMQIGIANSKNKVRRSTIGDLEMDESGSFKEASNVMVVRNPLFNIDNPEIARCLMVIDVMKEEGVLNKDFKL